MRIVIIGPAYPYRGGIADTDESLCRALLEKGHEAALRTFTVQYPDFLFPGKTQFSESPAPADLDIERVIHSYNPFSWSRSAKEILSYRPDLVIFRFWTPYIGLVYNALTRSLKGKSHMIALVDNANPHEGSFLDKWLSKRFLGKVQGVMCLSEYVKGQVQEMVSVPVASHPHPINTDLEAKIERNEALKNLGLDSSKHYILFFGLIRKYKGLDILLQSMVLLKERLPDLHLIVAGEFYEDQGPYLKYIATHGIEEQVIIHDRFISKEDIANYFSAVELLTLTYRSATQSGVTQMAMHFDLPMLLTDVGALSEYVKHGEMGYVVPVEPEVIARSLEDFFNNDRHDSMSQAVSGQKHMYDWGHFAEAMIRFTEEL